MGSLAVAQAEEGLSLDLTMLGSLPMCIRLDALKLDHVRTLLTPSLRVHSRR